MTFYPVGIILAKYHKGHNLARRSYSYHERAEQPLLLAQIIERIAKIKIPEISPILGSENIWEYRNKMEYTFSNKKWLTRS